MRIVNAALAATLLAGCAAGPSTAPGSAGNAAPVPASQVLTVDAEPGRTVDLVVLRPAVVRGVVLFGHAQGGDASRYKALGDALTGAGWLVIAPTHVDSLRHPRRAQFDQRTGFAARIADVAAAARAAHTLAPGKPIVAVGHSYGSLLAAMQGGALSATIPARDPDVRAVLAFSTPGRIPGLIGPQSYATLDVPTMVITGDADVVPGFVPDWTQHLAMFADSPAGDKYALIVKGGGHMLAIDGTGVEHDRAIAEGLDFLAAYGLGDRAAKARLGRLRSTAGMEVRRR